MPLSIAMSELVSFGKDEGALHVNVQLVHSNADGPVYTEYVSPPVVEADLQALAEKRGHFTWDETDILALLNSRGYSPAIVRNRRVAEVAAMLKAQATAATDAAAATLLLN